GPTPGHADDDYFHPFNLPYGGEAPGLLPFWLDAAGAPGRPAWADASTSQEAVIRAGKGPKRAGDPDFSGPMNYAYHFDAARLAAYLRGKAVAAGVERIEATIGDVTRGEDGDILSISPNDGRAPIEGEFFIDCSGFRALLIGDTLGSPFKPVGDTLFNDRAVAIQLPYETPDAPIAPYTQATAHDAGWIWDIGLSQRRGTGCVYSSAHMDEDAAEATLRAYLGPQADAITARHLRFRTGYREQQWIGNCVAVGLSAGFFEPLESTGIMLIEIAARMLSEILPGADRAALAAASRHYNRMLPPRFAAITEFLKLHYCLSKRRDTPYWRDNTDAASIPEGLADKLAQWRHRLPSRFDFVVDHETFLPASWSYILYGMGFETPAPPISDASAADANTTFAKVRAATAQAIAVLPGHRALLDHYRQIS
ncbi:MAG: tryptophan halogenase, partial [Sphingomonas bacterium]|nr:tryptophan halogenase [Sphingomonas bacterium]